MIIQFENTHIEKERGKFPRLKSYQKVSLLWQFLFCSFTFFLVFSWRHSVTLHFQPNPRMVWIVIDKVQHWYKNWDLFLFSVRMLTRNGTRLLLNRQPELDHELANVAVAVSNSSNRSTRALFLRARLQANTPLSLPHVSRYKSVYALLSL